MSVLGLQRAQLVASVYEAALDPSRWGGFLSELVFATGSTTGIIWGHDFSQRTVTVPGRTSDTLFCSVGFSEQALAQFDAHYGALNVWLQNPALHVGGTVVHGEMLFPNSQLKKTEYWADWLRPQDLFYSSAAIVERTPDRSLNATVCRPEGAGPYSAQELGILAELMPHLQTGFALHRKFRDLDVLAGASTAVLDRMPLGVALFDESGALVHHNIRAKQLLAESSDILAVRGGRLVCSRPRENDRLAALLRAAVRTGLAESGSAGGAVRLQHSGGDTLHLFVTPLPSWSGPFGLRAAAAVFLSRPDGSIGALAKALQQVYQMTPAECRLTEALVNGLSAKEYGAQAGVSISTVRTQIRTATAKVGARRQVDLVRTVLLGPAALSRSAELWC
ncbi:helix-turn-helix transcriptional regulator [Pseudorhodoferax sp. LjRoot39]|uniref:helix-turn-helix transcriptional regulator n=1 Tax=Pseudorhodoferax sp. LjRoot39 TaxID=3342328 RepID=UPI003ECFB70C